MQPPDTFPDPNGVLNGPIAMPLPGIAGEGVREGQLLAVATAALTQRHAKLYENALDVVEGLLSGPDLPRGSQTKLAAATAVLDRMWPRKPTGAHVTLSANQLAIVVQQALPPPPSPT